MKHQAIKSNLSLEDIEKSVHDAFPDVKLFFRKSLIGKYLVLQRTRVVGVGIRIKGEEIIVSEIIPSPVMAGLMGSFGMLGFALVRMSNRKLWKQFNEEVSSHIAKTFC